MLLGVILQIKVHCRQLKHGRSVAEASSRGPREQQAEEAKEGEEEQEGERGKPCTSPFLF